MTHSPLTEIAGVYAANITPLNPDGSIALDRYLEHARWLLERGVRGLVPFGTNGEGPCFTAAEKVPVLEALFGALPGVPIIPALMEGSLAATLELWRALRHLPAQALLVLPPYYYKPVADAALVDCYRALLAECERPVIAYHVPKYAVPVSLEALAQLPLWGVKESEGNPDYARGVRALGQSFLLGTEDDLPGGLARGAGGAISALCNIAPEAVLRCHDAARAGDSQAGALSRELQALRALTKQHHSVALLKRLAGEHQGRDFGGVRLPHQPLDPAADLSALRERLSRLCA